MRKETEKTEPTFELERGIWSTNFRRRMAETRVHQVRSRPNLRWGQSFGNGEAQGGA